MKKTKKGIKPWHWLLIIAGVIFFLIEFHPIFTLFLLAILGGGIFYFVKNS
jgi:hypothetical protein